ncbi:NUDIX hydrolase [Cumulibacter manganitolerans]|uniref:NUDIX hydrolase n=1 Tax=Cumulibacter manganitolerans TaxID=1884992 RepID=UPI001295E729|nr:CoA pyrophosphatase [Cumulibacter manganitolerans]
MSVRVTREQATARLAGFEPIIAPETGHRRAAVVLAIVENDGVQGIWLTKRQPTLRSHSGQWALPGGRLDDGETGEQAALRELHEEVGYAAHADDIVGRLDDYVTRSGYVMSPYVLWVGADPRYRVNADEVVWLFDIPFDELDVEPNFLSIPESDRPVIQLPLLGRKVHAPTAAVMYQFREVVLRGRPTRVGHLEQPVFAWK